MNPKLDFISKVESGDSGCGNDEQEGGDDGTPEKATASCVLVSQDYHLSLSSWNHSSVVSDSSSSSTGIWYLASSHLPRSTSLHRSVQKG